MSELHELNVYIIRLHEKESSGYSVVYRQRTSIKRTFLAAQLKLLIFHLKLGNKSKENTKTDIFVLWKQQSENLLGCIFSKALWIQLIKHSPADRETFFFFFFLTRRTVSDQEHYVWVDEKCDWIILLLRTI